MTSTILFLTGVLLVAATCGSPALGAETQGASAVPPLVAYLDGDKLYCLCVLDRFGLSDRRPMEFWHAKLTVRESFRKEKQLIHVPIAYERLPDRWRVGHGYFWWLEDHKTQDAGSGDIAVVRRIPLSQVSSPFDTKREMEGEWEMPPLGPVYDLRYHHSDMAAKEVYYDVIPNNKEEFHLLLAWRGEVRVWRGAYHWKNRDESPNLKEKNDNPKGLPEIEWDDKARPSLRVRTDLREAFLAYQNGTHFFFLTVSGKLYTCRKRGENQRTEVLWGDARSPIRAIIHDTASQKSFAFTRAIRPDDKEGRAVCFELAPKLDPFTYDPKKVPELKQDDPLATMIEYARILLREKKLKLENEKSTPKTP